MSRKVLKQYLELLAYSGVDSLIQLKEESNDDLTEPKRVNKKQDNLLQEKPNSTDSNKETLTDKETLLAEKRQSYKNCQKCSLHNNRINFVYGEGNANSDLMLIGEGPGSEENKQGRPFVGRAGQLLTKMLAAIHLKREDVYIANIVKCQPPDNRNPLPDEVSHCLPYLYEQIDIIKPKLIVLLGKVAASSMLGLNEPLGQMRERTFWIDVPTRSDEASSLLHTGGSLNSDSSSKENHRKRIETYVTYHPAALLRNPNFKKSSWIDLQKYRDILGINP